MPTQLEMQFLLKECPCFGGGERSKLCFVRVTTGIPQQTNATDLLSSTVVVMEYLHSIVHKFSLPAYVLSDASPLSYLNAAR